MCIKECSVTIVICTRNRSQYLKACLESLIHQVVAAISAGNKISILVVDNASTDNTQEIVSDFARKHSFIHLVQEFRVGLSFARNTGYKSVHSDWIIYLDDDAKAHSDLVEQALYTTGNFNFHAFGGRFHLWFKYGRPAWFPENFEGGGHVSPTDQPVTLTDGYFNGCIMAFKRDILEKVGGFPEEYGMTGNKVGYGEETKLQATLIQLGYSLGYNPSLGIDHLVAPYKLHLLWHIKSKFAHGRDEYGIYTFRFPWHQLLFELGKVVLVRTPKAIIKLLIRRQYYWQNAVLETIGAAAYQIGRYVGAKRLRATAE